jgi:hypothetical protein
MECSLLSWERADAGEWTVSNGWYSCSTCHSTAWQEPPPTHGQLLYFWHPMMFFIFESALVNSYILYQTTREKAGLTVDYTASKFRESVAVSLASQWEGMGCCFRSEEVSPTKTVRESTFHGIRRKVDVNSDYGDRYSAPDKHVSYLAKIPNKDGSTLVRRQLICSHCRESRTTQWCRLCLAPLCSITCWVMFHTDPEL